MTSYILSGSSGLAMWPVIPARVDLAMSSMKALAVRAMMGILAVSALARSRMAPVSYTHLDVYNRQVQSIPARFVLSINRVEKITQVLIRLTPNPKS